MSGQGRGGRVAGQLQGLPFGRACNKDDLDARGSRPDFALSSVVPEHPEARVLVRPAPLLPLP